MTWRCHICGGVFEPKEVHLNTKYRYAFAHCPNPACCGAKVERGVKRGLWAFVAWSILFLGFVGLAVWGAGDQMGLW